jgi:LptD protein
MRAYLRRKTVHWLLFCCFWCLLAGTLHAQRSGATRADSLRTGSGIGVRANSTIGARGDSAVVPKTTRNVRISKDALDEEVTYSSDSMWFDVKNKQLHLYYNAEVKYTNIEIKAGYILLDYGNNVVTATTAPDSTGKEAGAPDFKSDEQSFTSKKIKYNFKNKKGIIYETRTTQDDLFVLGEKAKFVGAPGTDTTQSNIIYNQHALITSCNHPNPHFGIRTSKLKVIPNKLIIAGLSNVEIGGIPTPLILPFGFYPITKSRKAGVIIPTDFEFADREGLGIRDFGWYQPISEHMDLTTYFNAYVSGSWGTRSNLRYNKRYHYSGDFQFEYNRRVSENEQAVKIPQQSFGIRMSHRQDAKAHPTRTFGGSVNIQTNGNQNRNRNDFNSVYQNTLSSNINYSRTFPGKPYNFTAGFSHTQNTQTRIMNISLPNAQFTMQRIYPFKRRNPVGAEEWYEKISLVYSANLQNNIQAVDTSILSAQTLRNFRAGIQHRASTDLNLKVLKYINLTPNISIEENWYPYSIERRWVNKPVEVYDTLREGGQTILVLNPDKTRYGFDTLDRKYRFNRFHNLNWGVSMGTALFFTKQYKKGFFRGIRHSIKPSVSGGYGTDYSKARFAPYFRHYIRTPRPGQRDSVNYTIFDEGVYGRPSLGMRDLNLGYSIANLLEIKVATRDTVRKIRIFDNLVFSGSFSAFADSLKWSPVGTGGVFRLFKGITNIGWNVVFDPYKLNDRGQRVNRFVVREDGKLLRLSQFNVVFNTGFTVSQLRGMLTKTKKDANGNALTQPVNSSGGTAPDDLLGLFDNFSVSHNITFTRQNVPGGIRDTLLVSGNNISLSGSIPLSPKWSINLNNISYDFQSRSIVYPDLGFTRDLHCWQMSLSWQPTRGTYQFFLNVKPGTLGFLKVPYRKNNFDSGRF